MNRNGIAYPIKVSSNGRYFVDQAGEPFFWLGDTAWPLFAQYSREEAETYLENRSAKGFTVIQGVLAWGGSPRWTRRALFRWVSSKRSPPQWTTQTFTSPSTSEDAVLVLEAY